MAQNNLYRPENERATWYEFATFTVSNGVTDYDVKAQQTALFGGSTSPFASTSTNANQKIRRIVRLSTSAKIWVKFDSNPRIIMDTTDSPWVEVNLNVSNIYLTPQGADCTVSITLYK